MSLPSGLIFFLDFTFSAGNGNGAGSPWAPDTSLYGGGVVGRQITGGVDLSGQNESKSFYNLNNGFASPTGSALAVEVTILASGTFGGTGLQAVAGVAGGFQVDNDLRANGGTGAGITTQAAFDRLCRYDTRLISGTSIVAIGQVATSQLVTTEGNSYIKQDLIAVSGTFATEAGDGQLRALNSLSGTNGGFRKPGEADSNMLLVAADLAGTATPMTMTSSISGSQTFRFPIDDRFINGGADVGSIVGSVAWGLENNDTIPEIDIKVDSVSITADTKKLKAKWTPELQQDINAYHNLDAEVELTGILSEQIALEIDQEILNDLINQATAGTYYWSRKPGKFVARTSGQTTNQSLYPDFTGTVSEWYETLLETVNDVSANIHRKTLRGGANFIVTSPEVANVLEFTSGFRADTTADENRGTAGAVKVGAISKKWDVYVDPYFPRNLVLVGRKGNSFLESGYVYAPYVPLQVTPTIFGPEDFVPRKGVMTRYGKKMVRPDMYGLVVVEDLTN